MKLHFSNYFNLRVTFQLFSTAMSTSSTSEGSSYLPVGSSHEHQTLLLPESDHQIEPSNPQNDFFYTSNDPPKQIISDIEPIFYPSNDPPQQIVSEQKQTFQFSPQSVSSFQETFPVENIEIENSEVIVDQTSRIPDSTFVTTPVLQSQNLQSEIKKRPIVFFDITVDNTPAGTIFIELFNETVPKTAENFRVLATGEINF